MQEFSGEIGGVKGRWMLASRRLGASVRLPDRGTWRLTALTGGGYLLVAAPLALGAGIVEPSSATLAPVELLPLASRVLLLPALVEEVIFRVLPNPHPLERRRFRPVLTAGVLSLGSYVVLHPLAGLLTGTRQPFLDPVFLLLAALLGSCCLFLYRRGGSLWPPVALHWLVVTGWLALGGRGVLGV